VNGKPYEGGMDGGQSPGPSAGDLVTFKKRYFTFKNGKRAESWNPS